VADQFFAHSLASIRGWERAIDAQLRICPRVRSNGCWPEIDRVTCCSSAHGAVGTLLFCHYSGFAVSRAYDQPAGGGHYFTLVKDGRRVLHPWRRMEDLPPA